MDGFVIERMGDENVVRLSDEDMRSRGLSVGDRVDLRDFASSPPLADR